MAGIAGKGKFLAMMKAEGGEGERPHRGMGMREGAERNEPKVKGKKPMPPMKGKKPMPQMKGGAKKMPMKDMGALRSYLK